MKKHIFFFFVALSLVSGCATKQIATMQEVLPPERLKAKNCYLWSVVNNDTVKMVSTTAPLIPLMIIFPPLILVATAVNAANAASDIAVKEATKKCSLTTEEATEQAVFQSYIENSSVRWWTKIAPFETINVSAPLNVDALNDKFTDCKATKIETRFTDEYENRSPKYSLFSYYQICKNNDGEPVIANKEFPEQVYTKLLPKIVEEPSDSPRH